MRGLKLITDETNKKQYVQIELNELFRNPKKIARVLEVQVLVSRLQEKMTPWKDVKKALKKKRKL